MVVMLAAHNLTVAKRLNDVTVSLEPGTISAICGPNGAGKSTLLQGLAGLIEADSGEVLLGTAPLPHGPERARRIGYLPQVGEVAWDLSVAALVRLGRLPHGDRNEPSVAAALAAVDLAHLVERPMSTLSGGERSRALLARVLAGEPEWILADEPLAALDLGHQLSLLEQLRQAAESGAGVVLVLHDLALAMNHADRVLVLDGGRLMIDGRPAEALSPDIIQRVWGVTAEWLGDEASRALVLAHEGLSSKLR